MPDLHLRLADDETSSASPAAMPPPLDDDVAISLLERADICDETQVPWGSNYTFAVTLQEPDSGEVIRFGIYKPVLGERPLWDFPRNTLYLRERASWLLADMLGWRIVPPTVVREGPLGVGSVQLYHEPGEEMDQHAALTFWSRKTVEMEQIVLFDLLANNADRKLTHCLCDVHGRIRGIDHGLTFNVAPKLRTVLWQFVGEPVSPELLGNIACARNEEQTLRERFAEVLAPMEIEALLGRFDRLLTSERHPKLNPQRNIPYGWW